jgi:antitoxin component YwqK of YwqJK toxin-antitoxin module/predicted Zn-dependent protease
MAKINGNDPGLSELANSVGGINSATFQDFIKIVNASPQYASQLQSYLESHAGGIAINQNLIVTGADGVGKVAAGITDPKTTQVTINTASSQLTVDPTMKSQGYTLAEILAHELGHVADFTKNSNPGGVTGEARAEINAYALMGEADRNLAKAGNISSAAGGDLFRMNPSTYLPYTGPTLFPAADLAIAAVIGKSSDFASLNQTCGVQSACEALVAAAMQQSGYAGYYPNGQSPILTSNGYNVIVDAANPNQIDIVNATTGVISQTIVTSVGSDGSSNFSILNVGTGDRLSGAIDSNGAQTVSQFDSMGREFLRKNYNPLGIETLENVFDASGSLIDQKFFDPAGQISQDQIHADGYISSAINYKDGVKTDQVFYNPQQQPTGQAIFDSSGAQTHYKVFDPASGQLVQDQIVRNGIITSAINYTNGIEVNETFYDPSQHITGQTTYDASGKEVSHKEYNPSNGQVTFDQEFSNGQLHDATTYNNGVVIDQKFYNPGGQLTQDQIFTDGHISSAINYDNGVKTDQVFYDASQHPTQQTVFTSSGDVSYYNVFDPSTGQLTKKEFVQDGYIHDITNYKDGIVVDQGFYNSSGLLTQDQIYTNGKLTSAINYSNGVATNQFFLDDNKHPILNVNYNSAGLRTDQSKIDPNTGQETERDLYATPGSQFASTISVFASNGKESFRNTYDANGNWTGQLNFDTTDGHLLSKHIISNGLETEKFNYTPGWQYPTQDIVFMPNGHDIFNITYFNQSGQELQQDTFSSSGNGSVVHRWLFNAGDQHANSEVFFRTDGTLSSQVLYNSAGQKIESNTFNAEAQLTDRFSFNPGQQYAYRQDTFIPGFPYETRATTFDGNTGVATGSTSFDPNTGKPLATGPDWTQFHSILGGSSVGIYFPTIGVNAGNGYAGVTFNFGFGFAGSAAVIKNGLSQDVSALVPSGSLDQPGGLDAVRRGLDEARSIANSDPSSSVGAPRLEGATWGKSEVSWHLNTPIGVQPGSDLYASYEDAVKQAFSQWEASTGIHFVETDDVAATDINIGWKQFGTGQTGVIGNTGFSSQSGRILSGAQIDLEDPFETSLTRGADGSLHYAGTDATLEQVALHEIGHAIGLSDTADSHSVMYYELTNRNRTLDSTDQQGGSLVGANNNPTSDALVGQMIQAMASYGALEPGAATLSNGPVLRPVHPLLATPAH